MITAFFVLLLLYFSIIGYSYIFKLFLNHKDYKKILIYNSDIIYGLFFLCIISISINFFYALEKVKYIIFIIGLIFFFQSYLNKKLKINFFTISFFIFSLIFISYSNAVIYDSQLYHLQLIKFNTYYKSIFGIANLEDRYAMNSSWHSIISLFNFSYNGFKALYLFNILIYSFIFSEAFKLNSKSNIVSNSFLKFSIIYILIYSIFHPSGNGTIINNLGSPEVDTVAAMLFLYGVYLFLKYTEDNNYLVAEPLILISVMVFTIKINYLAILILPVWFFLKKNLLFYYIKSFIVSFVLILVWITKSFISSGCLLFPVSFTCTDFSWSLHSEDVENYKNIIMSFARDTPERAKFGDFEYTLNSFDWVFPWFKQYFLKTEFLYISLFIFLVSFFFILFLFIKKKNFIFEKKYLFIFIVLFFNLYLWFYAPEIRFGYGTIISLVTMPIVIYLHNLKKNILLHPYGKSLMIILILILSFKNNKNIYLFNEDFVRSYNYDTLTVMYVDKIKIYTPGQGAFCSDFIYYCAYKKNTDLKYVANNYIYFLNSR
jgi:hypothetical protein